MKLKKIKPFKYGRKAMEQKQEEVIRNEYVSLCAQAGELQFKIGQFQAALADINGKISKLNEDYAALKAAPPAPTEAPSVEAPVSPEAA